MPQLDGPAAETVFAVVDVETTGLGRADRIIEVACVRVHNRVECGRFASLVNPGMAIAPAASRISGITDAMVAQAPIFPEISTRLDELLDGAVLVAHNAPFDLQFLSRERRRWNLPARKGPVLDTLRLARNTLKLPGYSLSALIDALGIEQQPSHRALADVLATARLLEELLARLDPPPAKLADLLKAQDPRPASWAQAIGAGLPEAIAAPLAEAAEAGRIVEIEYESHTGVHAYWVRPLGMEHNGPLYHLRAELAERREVRTFRTERILSARISGNLPGNQERAPENDT